MYIMTRIHKITGESQKYCSKCEERLLARMYNFAADHKMRIYPIVSDENRQFLASSIQCRDKYIFELSKDDYLIFVE